MSCSKRHSPKLHVSNVADERAGAAAAFGANSPFAVGWVGEGGGGGGARSGAPVGYFNEALTRGNGRLRYSVLVHEQNVTFFEVRNNVMSVLVAAHQ